MSADVENTWREGDPVSRRINHMARNGPDIGSIANTAAQMFEPNYFHDTNTAARRAWSEGNYPAWFTYQALAPVAVAADIGSMASIGKVGQLANAGYRGVRRAVNRFLDPHIPHGYGHPASVAPTYFMPGAQWNGLLPRDEAGSGSEPEPSQAPIGR
jgi:hypothetical protein